MNGEHRDDWGSVGDKEIAYRQVTRVRTSEVAWGRSEGEVFYNRKVLREWGEGRRDKWA
jgi:hypothetical protein